VRSVLVSRDGVVLFSEGFFISLVGFGEFGFFNRRLTQM
jgi:hypothetical protein